MLEGVQQCLVPPRVACRRLAMRPEPSTPLPRTGKQFTPYSGDALSRGPSLGTGEKFVTVQITCDG